MIAITMENLTTHLTEEDQFSLKILADRYMLKDSEATPKVGSPVVVELDVLDAEGNSVLDENGHKRTIKEVAIVTDTYAGLYTIDLFTGNRGNVVIDVKKEQLEVLLEYSDTQVKQRIAKALSGGDEKLQSDLEELVLDKIIFGGRILAGAGTDQELTYFNCFSGDTIVQTLEGAKQIKDLKGEHDIYTIDGVIRKADFKSYGVQELFEVKLSNGETFKATAGHEWLVTKKQGGLEKVTTLDLEGRRVPLVPRKEREFTSEVVEGLKHGIVYGDGSRNDKESYVMLFGEKESLASYFWGGTSHYDNKYVRVGNLPRYYKDLPEGVTDDYWHGFVLGLLAVDGYCDSNGSSGLHSSKLEELQEIANNLYKTGMSHSSIKMTRELSPYDGSYKPTYRLQFVKNFMHENYYLKRSHKEKFKNSPKGRNKATLEIVSVKALNISEEVYCCEEMETHTMVVGSGVLTRQCYVLPFIHDSRGGISKHRENVMEVMSRGGGVGTNGSTLRPSKTKVHKVRGRSSGAVSWLHDLSELTHLVEQGGSRRGAQMIALADWHPDLIDFITAKAQKPLKADLTINGEKKTIKFGKVNNQRLTGANISVLISDKFMETVKQNGDWELRFPDVANYTSEEMEIYDDKWSELGDPDKFHEATGLAIKTHAVIPARDILNLIGVASHGSAEPGTLFLERANKFSNTWYFNQLICTNPCGEQFLSAWSVCNLGHINLSKFVIWDDSRGKYIMDWDELRRATQILTRALDNVIDATPYYFDINKKQQESERRLGLGTLGVDEALKLMGYDYGEPTGRSMAEDIFRDITRTAYYESVLLATEKGAFPQFDVDKYLQSEFMKFMAKEDPELIGFIKSYGIRNATIITQAPTGTTGTMAQTSTGIEPFFAGEFYRSSRIGFTKQTAPVIKRMQEKGMDTSKLKFAGDYTTKQHLDFQAVAQKWCDSSISKTINAPKGITVEDVTELMEYAYEIGLKGFTVYVDGSRDTQVLSTEKDSNEPAVEETWKHEGLLTGRTHKIETSYGRLYVTFNRDETGKLREVFFNIGKAGSDVLATLEGYGRLLSLMLQNSQIPEEDIVKQLSGIQGSNPYGFGANKVLSIPDSISVAFKREMSVTTPEKTIEVTNKDTCSCGAPMIFIEGCIKCEACGNSKCN